MEVIGLILYYFIAPGAGKTNFIKQLQFLNRDHYVYDENQINEDKRFLQYDLVLGTLRVMECMQNYVNDDDPDYVERVALSEEEVILLDEMTAIIEEMQITGGKVHFYINFKLYLDFLVLPKRNQQPEVKGIMRIDDERWTELATVTQRPEFKDMLALRFTPEDELFSKPLIVTDGFPELIKIENIWDQALTENPRDRTLLCVRRPDGGLPGRSKIFNPFETTEDNPPLALTELPGRMESFTDILSYIKDDVNFEVLLMIVSISDFDLKVSLDEEEETVYNFILSVADQMNNFFEKKPILLVFTKLDVAREKLKFYKENGYLEKQMKASGYDNISQETYDSDTFDIEIIKKITDNFHEKLQERLVGEIFPFPRMLKYDYDMNDARELYFFLLHGKRMDTY